MGDTDSEDQLRHSLGRPPTTSAAHDAAVLEAARAFARGKPESDTAAPSRMRARSRLWMSLAAAASVTVLTVSMVSLLRLPQAEDVLRDGSRVVRVGVSPSTGQTLASPPSEFRWPSQAGADTYQVVLRDTNATIIWRSPAVKTTRVELDPAVRASLQSQTFYWSLEVNRAGQQRTVGPFWFRLSNLSPRVSS